VGPFADERADPVHGATSVGEHREVLEGVTVDAENVYWTTRGNTPGAGMVAGTVMKAPLGGGSAIQLTSDPPHVPRAVAVDAQSVYWTDPLGEGDTSSTGALKKVSLTGEQEQTLVTDLEFADNLALDADGICWTVDGPTFTGVMQASFDGSGATRLAGMQGETHALVVRPTGIYWTCYSEGAIHELLRD
jgi:hypothetical protein